jgi:hypothetical protein
VHISYITNICTLALGWRHLFSSLPTIYIISSASHLAVRLVPQIKVAQPSDQSNKTYHDEYCHCESDEPGRKEEKKEIYLYSICNHIILIPHHHFLLSSQPSTLITLVPSNSSSPCYLPTLHLPKLNSSPLSSLLSSLLSAGLSNGSDTILVTCGR